MKGPGQRHCADTTPTTAPPRRGTSGPPAASTGSHPQAPRRAAHAPPRPFREGRRFSSRSAATGVDSRRASCVRWPLVPDTPPLTGGVWAPLEVPWRPEGEKPASTCEPPRDGVLGCPEVSLDTANTDLMSRPLPKRGRHSRHGHFTRAGASAALLAIGPISHRCHTARGVSAGGQRQARRAVGGLAVSVSAREPWPPCDCSARPCGRPAWASGPVLCGGASPGRAASLRCDRLAVPRSSCSVSIILLKAPFRLEASSRSGCRRFVSEVLGFSSNVFGGGSTTAPGGLASQRRPETPNPGRAPVPSSEPCSVT